MPLVYLIKDYNRDGNQPPLQPFVKLGKYKNKNLKSKYFFFLKNKIRQLDLYFENILYKKITHREYK